MNNVNRTAERPRLSPTARIAGWSAGHRWLVIAASAIVVLLAIFVSNSVETKTLDDDAGGVGESAKGIDLIDERFDVVTVPTEQLVFSNPSLDVNAPVFRSTVESLVQGLRALPEVASVASFYDTGDPNMVSEDGRVLLALIVT